ncbi:hypothetical protein OPT61_g1467 [Boeremia exigua]|uniref:Uncharacterized protein n=1 Tax=Boeremia exigua TaxID=749465 RepID=A0ACC2IQ36_9PLEO|nr:hypothetical protein OPT61_g1467 [Boeremia exigua]
MAAIEEQPSDSPGKSAPPAKRRRIGVACNACRTRKSRCNGQRPRCSTCEAMNFECHYEPSESTSSMVARKDCLADLETRMTSFERMLQRHDDLLRGHLSACVSNAATTSRAPTHASRDALGLASGLQEGDWHAPSLEEPSDEEAGTDGLAMSFVEESTSAYFGESSNINFTRLLLRVIAAMRNEAPSMQAAAGQEYSMVEKKMANFMQESRSSKEDSTATSHASMQALPSIEDMDGMLDIFFRTTGLHFPFIDEVMFRETYRECIVMRLSPVRRTWLGTLNMIFAMASLSGREGAASVRANHFYQRAVALCEEVSKHVISLEVVHYQLLVVLYCQGTQRSVQAWTLHGLLVRSAIALGLHTARIEHPKDACRQESGNRTWLTIYCLDTVLSMTFGRPAAIPEAYMVPKLPEPWPYASASTFSNNDDLSRHFLGVSVKLYEIMGQSLSKQYGANVGRNDLEVDDMARFQALSELRKSLGSWVSTLPSHLQLCPPGARELIQTSQVNKVRVIITLKYHNLRILIHRPLLSAALRYLAGGDTSLSTIPPYQIQLAMAEAQEGVKSAESTIDIVHSILIVDHTACNNLGVWFFTLYYVFTASLIVAAQLLWAQNGGGDVKETSVAHHRAFLEKADEIFHKIDHESDLIMSCARYIRYLSQLCDARVAFDSTETRGHYSTISPSTLAEPNSNEQSGAPTGSKDSGSMGLNVDTLSLFSAEFLDPSVFDCFSGTGGDSSFTGAFISN